MLTLQLQSQGTQHESASFVSTQIVMGPTILRATRIYRRRSVMIKVAFLSEDFDLISVSVI